MDEFKNQHNYSTANFCVLIQAGHYKSINAMAKDVDLLTKNAKTYNEPGSQVFKVVTLYIVQWLFIL